MITNDFSSIDWCLAQSLSERLPPTAKRSNIETHSQTLGRTRGPQERGGGRIIGANGEKDIGENSPHSQQRRTHRDSQRRK